MEAKPLVMIAAGHWSVERSCLSKTSSFESPLRGLSLSDDDDVVMMTMMLGPIKSLCDPSPKGWPKVAPYRDKAEFTTKVCK